MTFLSAATDKGLLFVDADMTDLSCGSEGTGDDFSIMHDTTADTGSQSDHHQILMSLTTTFPHLSQSRRISIICHHDFFYSCKTPDFCGHIQNSPSQIGTLIYNTLLQNRSRNIDSDSQNLIFQDSLFFHFLFNRLCNIT